MPPDHPAMATCPKCRFDMVYVTSMPHPKAPQMLKTTFVCFRCNRTFSYPLSPEMAAAYSNEAITEPGLPG
jgi:transposase-like protein